MNQHLNQKRKREENTKKDKVTQIKRNLEIIGEMFQKEEIVNLFNGLCKFTYDELSKFYQNVANKEFLSLTYNEIKAKEPISLNTNALKYDPIQALTQQSNSLTQITSQHIDNIDQIIIKNTPAKIINYSLMNNNSDTTTNTNSNAVAPNDNNSAQVNDTHNTNNEQDNNNNNNSSNSNTNKETNVHLTDYFNTISLNLKSILHEDTLLLSVSQIQNIIHIYSKFIHISNKLSADEDNTLLSIIQNQSSLNNIYILFSYWLNTEYTLSAESKEFFRYEALLEKMLSLLSDEHFITRSNTTNTESASSFNTFISNIPCYNKTFIDYIISYHINYYTGNYTYIKTECTKYDITELIPYLDSFTTIYSNITNNEDKVLKGNKTEYKLKLLNCFINLTMNDSQQFNLKAITYLLNNITVISLDTDEFIKSTVVNALKEISTLTETIPENAKFDTNDSTLFIEKRLPLFLMLCSRTIDLIQNYPKMYIECNDNVRNYINKTYNKFFGRILHDFIDRSNAEKLIEECNEKSEIIVVLVIRTVYGNHKKFSIESKINDEKLFRNINKYYNAYGGVNGELTQGIMEMSTKIPLSDFYTEYNFVLNYVNKWGDSSDMKDNYNLIMKTLNDNNMFLWIFKEFDISDESGFVKNKLVYYVIYYYSHVVNKSGYDNIIVKFISYLNSLCLIGTSNDNSNSNSNSNEHTNTTTNDDAITTNDNTNVINEILSVSKQHLNIKEYLIFIEKQLDILDNNNTSQQQSPNYKQLIPLYINTLPLFLTSKQSNPHSHPISNDDYDSIITFIKKHKDTKETITSSLPNEIKIELRNRDLIFFGDL